MNKPTLALLNTNDNPRDFGGKMMGEDGQGNQLWLFLSQDKVANRFEDEGGEVFWSDDIVGWNYTPDYALE